MDSVDKRILTVLRDGKPWDFHQFLREAGFSQNTLRLHPTSLKRQGMVVKAKTPKNGPGRPRSTYSLPPNVRHQADLIVTEPYTTIVSLTFQKLRHLCRFEKGGYCKKIKDRCTPQNCPQTLKKE
jgi:predicted ArsR family transcriptional regulator